MRIGFNIARKDPPRAQGLRRERQNSRPAADVNNGIAFSEMLLQGINHQLRAFVTPGAEDAVRVNREAKASRWSWRFYPGGRDHEALSNQDRLPVVADIRNAGFDDDLSIETSKVAIIFEKRSQPSVLLDNAKRAMLPKFGDESILIGEGPAKKNRLQPSVYSQRLCGIEPREPKRGK